MLFRSDWPHRHECLRINYSQDPATVEKGLKLIAVELRRALKMGTGPNQK